MTVIRCVHFMGEKKNVIVQLWRRNIHKAKPKKTFLLKKIKKINP